MWINYFDAIFLINLPSRKDRYLSAIRELALNKIPYERIFAIKQTNGEAGLSETMLRLFRDCVNKGYRRILVFEDDIKFLINPNEYLDACIKELPGDFDLFYLGCNLTKPVTYFSENILKITRALSTHAVAYSYDCMLQILNTRKILPFDRMLADTVQVRNKSLCTRILVATQRPGYSDIKRFAINWSILIEQNFKKHTLKVPYA